MIRDPETLKKRYRVGDRIRIRPRFAHLFPADVGLIRGVVTDSMRSLFNEYVVEFTDHSSASLFQFQISLIDSRAEASSKRRIG
jgi:hypothetical protein